MRRSALSLLACVLAANVNTRAAEPAKIELMVLKTVTVTEEQFLLGSQDGQPVTLAVELRLPTAGTARLPAVILLHGSGGIAANNDHWARELNDLGIATLMVDSFTGRGITNTVGAQGQLSELTVIIDAYRAFDVLAQHPRIDSTRIGLLGNSRGAVSALYAGVKRFQRMYAPTGADFAVYLSLYPPCSRTYIDDADVVDRPIRLFNGADDDIAPLAPCLSYVKRLQATGKDAQLTAYEGAYHAFDSPGTPLTRVQAGDSQAKRGSCELYEQPAGRIMNRQTGLPFTRNDDCLKGVGTLGYDARAHAKVIADVTGLLQRVFKLQPPR
jgi:dienelactone hydrolase